MLDQFKEQFYHWLDVFKWFSVGAFAGIAAMFVIAMITICILVVLAGVGSFAESILVHLGNKANEFLESMK